MVKTKLCCCCMTLRTGTYMAAVFSLILGALGIVECILLLFGINKAEERIDANHAEQTTDQYGTDMAEMSVTIIKLTFYISIGLYGAWAIFAIFAICGVTCEKRCLLLPWLVFTGIVTGLCCWGVISSIKNFPGNLKDPHNATVMGTQIIVIAINIYSMAVVSSFYRNDLKEYDSQFASVPTMAPAGVDEEYGYKE